MNTKTALFSFSALLAVSAFATLTVSNVSVTHNQATRTVIVNYDLGGEDAIVTLDVKTNGVSIGATGLQATCGDVNRLVTAGTGKTICWYAERGWPARMYNSSSNIAFSADVKAWATNAPPKYMAVDLTGTNGVEVGHRFYCDDLDVTNRIYKTDYLVFRYIPAKGVVFPMGKWIRWGDNTYSGVRIYAYHRVTLTNNFYMAIYELTQGQFKNIWKRGKGSDIDNWWLTRFEERPVCPVDAYPCHNFRGIGYFWPRDGHLSATSDGSDATTLNVFRNTLNLPDLDLPTEAEWEFACRAGTAEGRYDGYDVANTGDYVSELGQIAWSSRNVSSGVPNEVGLKLPNQFGLYDMFGNVGEWCLDYYITNRTDASDYAIPVGGADYETAASSSPNATDPVGPDYDADGLSNDKDALRVVRGGSVLQTEWYALAYDRRGHMMSTDSTTSTRLGYRLVWVPVGTP